MLQTIIQLLIKNNYLFLFVLNFFKMKKNLLFLFLFVSLITKAQERLLSGKIVNQSNEPLSGASIIVKGLNKGVATDGEGNFKLRLTEGAYTLQISFIGYQSKEQEINLITDDSILIILLSNEFILDEVLVSAVRANSNTPVTFTNFDKKEIAKRNLGQDIPILLNYLPSVISSSDAGAGVGYTYLNVRGSNSERINVTINGIPYNDAESHGTFWVNLGDFASSTENLQLQRGVGTSTNGSGAFGASLNILTDAMADEAGGETSNSFGSFNTRKHTVKFTTGRINENFELSGRLSNISSEGYVDRAFADLKSYFLQAAYSDSNRLIKAITFGGNERTYQSWYGLDPQQLAENRRQNPYTYENEVDDYGQNHYQLHWNEIIDNHWSTNLSLNYTKGSGFFEQYKTEENASDFNNLIIDGSDLIVRRWLDNDFYVANFNANYSKEDLNIISGVSYSNYKGNHFGEVIWGSHLATNTSIRDRYYFSDALKKDLSLFSKTTFTISNKLSGYLDLQGRFVSYQTSGLTSDRAPIDVDSNFNFFNPKAGFIYRITENSDLYFSFARAHREPNRNDFENGVSTAERLDDFELGWRYRSEQFKLNANGYYMNYTDQLVLTGAIDDVGAPIRATSGKSYRLGFELDADYKISNSFSLQPNAAFSANRNQDFKAFVFGELKNLGDTPLSFSPGIIVGNRFTYTPSEHFQLALLSKYVGEQYMSNLGSEVSSLDVLEAYFTSDLNLVYQIEPKSVFKSIAFKALINNIFNAEYVDRGYYYTYDYSGGNGKTVTADGAGYYPQATANFLAGVTFKF
jgi:iron complex outermembrane receptor protein